jgi:hypothetical protein
MGLRDLFSRGPKLPEPVDDPFDGDPTLRAEALALQKGDWKPATARLAGARGDDRVFFASTYSAAGRGPVEKWHAAAPQDAGANLVRGIVQMGYAWEARGQGYADDVTEEAWAVFHGRLAEAEEFLQEAARRDPSDAAPWAYLALSARGLGLEPPEIRRRYDEARRRDPQGWSAARFALESLAEKWSGTHEEMFAFAREAAAAGGDGSGLHALVPLAHHERWLFLGAFDGDRKGQKKYFEGPAVQRELQAAWAKGPGSAAFRRGRFGATQTAVFAFAFTLGLDAARAREAFERLGPVVTPTPWSSQGEPADVFKQARAWAYSS